MTKQTLAVVIGACLLSILAGCSQVVPSSGPRKPTTPDVVKLYKEQPAKYEELGTVVVDITPQMKWDQQAEAPLAFDALKAKAAQLGANGLLFILPEGTFTYKVTARYKGEFYQIPAKGEPKTLLAQAIYVLEE